MIASSSPACRGFYFIKMQTSVAIGIGLGFVAMLSWGFGDFLIQKSSRKLGDWETLFYISLFGLIVFAPFVVRSLPAFIQGNVSNILILLGSAIIIFVAALLDFDTSACFSCDGWV